MLTPNGPFPDLTAQRYWHCSRATGGRAILDLAPLRGSDYRRADLAQPAVQPFRTRQIRGSNPRVGSSNVSILDALRVVSNLPGIRRPGAEVASTLPRPMIRVDPAERPVRGLGPESWRSVRLATVVSTLRRDGTHDR